MHMSAPNLDRCRFPPTLWRAFRAAGVEPASVLRLAGLPVTICLDPSTVLSTAQVFAIWKAVEELSDDPSLALQLVRAADQTGHQPAFIAALYGADFRDAIHRIERYKRLGTAETFRTQEDRGMWTIIKEWPFAVEPEPTISIDLSFAFLLELGRRGTGRRITPARIDYTGVRPRRGALEEYFGCRINHGASFNAMTFEIADLNRRFPGHSP
jgi:hypothetical protein